MGKSKQEKTHLEEVKEVLEEKIWVKDSWIEELENAYQKLKDQVDWKMITET